MTFFVTCLYTARFPRKFEKIQKHTKFKKSKNTRKFRNSKICKFEKHQRKIENEKTNTEKEIQKFHQPDSVTNWGRSENWPQSEGYPCCVNETACESKEAQRMACFRNSQKRRTINGATTSFWTAS